ncbi:MAG TPA: amidohydrolase family protein [Thermomicrobiales bacterium]|nr:amidohydrolase family protein [Thermomicrobiales bacterium]
MKTSTMTDRATQPVVIDSHHHLWDTTKRTFGWLQDLPAINRPFLPEDMRPLLAAAGVDATVLVQTIEDLDETREFLQFAADTDFIAGVVGWADLTDPAISDTLRTLKDGPNGQYLVGIRHLVHNEEEPDWLLRAEVQHGLNALADAGLVYDLLVRPRELPSAITVARDFPHLKMVVDHIAKPPIASGELEPWASLMREFAALEHVACKLSGMVTEADPVSWTIDDLKPYVSTVVEIFGPDRMMYGSDWPVCLLAADYQQVIGAARTTLDELGVLTPASEAAIFGNTAAHWYGLDLSPYR